MAQGIDAHESDLSRAHKFKNGYGSIFDYLKREIGSKFVVDSKTEAAYLNVSQRVRYKIKIVQSKKEFKEALETRDAHVVYLGHARFGRGACFDQYESDPDRDGNQWGQGYNGDNGLFRLGYDAIAIPVTDVEHHKYVFYPYPEGSTLPSRSDLHPEARGRVSLIELEADEIKALVHPLRRSSTNKYYGFARKSGHKILVAAGWENTESTPNDLGATALKCKVFCHFGCSTRLHFRKIIRGSNFKNWSQSKPAEDRFAYFTTAASNLFSTSWLYYVLVYPYPNNHMSWSNSLEWAKKKTNLKLRKEKQKFKLY